MSATTQPLVFTAVSKEDVPEAARSGSEPFAVEIPEGTTEISDFAFCSCKGLADITLPPGLTTIGANAFDGCEGLRQVTLPPGLTHIGERAFRYCKGLAQVTFPPGLTHIGEGAFYECGGLAEVTLPTGLAHIGAEAFRHCHKIATVLVTPDLAHCGPPAVLRTDEVCKLVATGLFLRDYAENGGGRAAAVRRGPLALTLTTLGGDTAEVGLPAVANPLPSDFSIAAEVVSAAAAELGVCRDEIYIVDGKVILYHPAIEVSIRSSDNNGTPDRTSTADDGTGAAADNVAADAALAGSAAETMPAMITLATEVGPTDDTIAPATVRHARDRIAAAAGIWPAGAAMLFLEAVDGVGSSVELTDLDATLGAAGVVNGAVLAVRWSAMAMVVDLARQAPWATTTAGVGLFRRWVAVRGRMVVVLLLLLLVVIVRDLQVPCGTRGPVSSGVLVCGAAIIHLGREMMEVVLLLLLLVVIVGNQQIWPASGSVATGALVCGAAIVLTVGLESVGRCSTVVLRLFCCLIPAAKHR